ncbi:MAG: hypothetical protein ACREE2_10540 [Stellaceae bacterium]
MNAEKADALKAEADRLQQQFRLILPRLAEARRRYVVTKTAADRARFEAIQDETSALSANLDTIVDAMIAAADLPPELLRIIEGLGSEIDPKHLPRRNLTEDQIATTGDLDADLPEALELVQRLLPPGWVEEEPADLCRLDHLAKPESILSLTKSLRRESELPAVHRFRQAIRVSLDYLSKHLTYDHFAGATVIPSLVQLGSKFDYLAQVGGDVEGRLQRLWSGRSENVDASLVELLTAARCAELGREVEFISESGQKSPDLRCHDPFPLVIECKRQRALSDYELSEEGIMRDLFLRLRKEARRRGLYGRFSLRLSVEAATIDLEDVVARLISQRLAPHPERELTYPWGWSAFIELPSRLELQNTTRLYSPMMLDQVFGWRSDLPEWDGLCCWIGNARAVTMTDVQEPLGLIWNNTSEAAMRKRTWAPTNLFGGAINQIPPGEFGIIYVAYCEGAREEVADLRVNAFMERIAMWKHASDTRIPIIFLCRLYPRPLGDGNPDLIESSVKLSSGTNESVLFKSFPATIFTQPDRRYSV